MNVAGLKGRFKSWPFILFKQRDNQGYVPVSTWRGVKIALKINFLVGNISEKNPLFCIVLVFCTVSQVLKNYLSIW